MVGLHTTDLNATILPQTLNGNEASMNVCIRWNALMNIILSHVGSLDRKQHGVVGLTNQYDCLSNLLIHSLVCIYFSIFHPAYVCERRMFVCGCERDDRTAALRSRRSLARSVRRLIFFKFRSLFIY